MEIYHYHPDYKHFLWKGLAEPSPLDPEGVWLIPAHATAVQLPEFAEGYIPVYSDESWSVIEDKRGVYYSTQRPQTTITNFDPSQSPERYTKEEPPEILPGKELHWNNGWVLEDIPVKPPLTAAEKLQQLGLTVEDLKELLGI
jgi:hypothetical protein